MTEDSETGAKVLVEKRNNLKREVEKCGTMIQAMKLCGIQAAFS